MFAKKKYIPHSLKNFSHVIFTRFGIGVFDEDWLSYRLKIFEKMTLPSVILQSRKEFVWFIFIDSDAPEKFKSRVFSFEGKFSFIKVVEIDFYFIYFDIAVDICKEIFSSCGSVLVSKIDDDDLIHKNFLDYCYNFLEGNIESRVLTFPKGYEFLLQERMVLRCDRPFLTHNTVFKISDLGHLDLIRVGHHKIEKYCLNKNIPINKVEAKEPFYLYTRHKQSDSNFAAVKKQILDDNLSKVITKSIYEAFSINKHEYLNLRNECRSFPSSPKEKTWKVNSRLNRDAEVLHKSMRKVKEEMILNSSNVF